MVMRGASLDSSLRPLVVIWYSWRRHAKSSVPSPPAVTSSCRPSHQAEPRIESCSVCSSPASNIDSSIPTTCAMWLP